MASCLFMTISARPSAPSSASFLTPRSYRLVNLAGDPHPVLDDLYDSQEAAWTEALRWWELQSESSQQPIGIGVEVSTLNGEWRTIRHPCT